MPCVIVLLRVQSFPLSTEILMPFTEKCRKKVISAYATCCLGSNIIVRAFKQKWKKKLALYSAKNAMKKDTVLFACCFASGFECNFANGFPSGASRTVPSKKSQYD